MEAEISSMVIQTETVNRGDIWKRIILFKRLIAHALFDVLICSQLWGFWRNLSAYKWKWKSDNRFDLVTTIPVAFQLELSFHLLNLLRFSILMHFCAFIQEFTTLPNRDPMQRDCSCAASYTPQFCVTSCAHEVQPSTPPSLVVLASMLRLALEPMKSSSRIVNLISSLWQPPALAILSFFAENYDVSVAENTSLKRLEDVVREGDTVPHTLNVIKILCLKLDHNLCVVKTERVLS